MTSGRLPIGVRRGKVLCREPANPGEPFRNGHDADLDASDDDGGRVGRAEDPAVVVSDGPGIGVDLEVAAVEVEDTADGDTRAGVSRLLLAAGPGERGIRDLAVSGSRGGMDHPEIRVIPDPITSIPCYCRS